MKNAPVTLKYAPHQRPPCSDKLRDNYENREPYIEVDLSDLKAWDAVLHDAVVQTPNEYIPMVRARPFSGSASLLCGADADRSPTAPLICVRCLLRHSLCSASVCGRTAAIARARYLPLLPSFFYPSPFLHVRL